jgi:hypothetical protein
MGKRTRSRPGDFVALPLPSGGYAYGRVLDKLMAFYDLRTDELADLDQIAKSSVLFITAVHMPAISSDRWPIIGNRPLGLELREETKFFRKNPSGQGFLIYVSKPKSPNAYEEYAAPAEECRGLEPLLVWEPDQIEQRIDDHLQKRENPHLSHYLQQLVGQDRRILN